MYINLIIVILFGCVAARNENTSSIYRSLAEQGNNVQSESDPTSTMENIEKLVARISNQPNCPCEYYLSDVATKADLEDLKRDLIDGISAIITNKCKPKPIDCEDIRNEGYKKTGIYTIYPFGNENGASVRCDMDISGGGWTVIQRRVSESDFYKTWTEYEAGFGETSRNFYIGNNFLHQFTNQGRYMLRVDLTSFEGETAYVECNGFSIGSAESKYQLQVGGCTGTAGDSLVSQNGMKFSTYDQDNDVWPKNCAKVFHGAWWYKNCHHSNLNGLYGSTAFGKGTNWFTWKGHHTSMKTMEMKLRRKY